MKRAQYLLYYIAICLLQDIYCAIHHATNRNNDKIVGGHIISIEERPEMAYLLLLLEDDEYTNCGGTIIDEFTILTAAHCFNKVVDVKVRVGMSSFVSEEDEDSYISAKTILIHPDFNLDILEYDVGIIKLSEKLSINGITTKATSIVESGFNVPVGSEVEVSGWGSTEEDEFVDPSNLMSVMVKIVSNEECKRTYRFLRDSMICAGVKEGEKDSCQGDSGGPAILTASGKQVGIISFGFGCGRPNVPGVYTNLGNIRINKWIKDNSENK